MKELKMLLIFLLCISCQGQEKNEKATSKPSVVVNAEQEYKKQKSRFEIQGYKLFFNNINLKSDTIANVFKVLGEPSINEEMYYIDKPILLDYKNIIQKDKDGRRLFKNKITNKISSLTETNMDEYNKNGKTIYALDKTGATLKVIRKYRIIFKKHKPSYVAGKRDSLLMQIPALEGFVKINGFYIDKNTKREELVAKLKPTVKNADFFNSRGTISTWYYATENGEPLTKFDPRIRPTFDGYIRIDYAYFDDELYAIDYYYSILE